jgi:hypothetical protein
MTYYFSKILEVGFDRVVCKVTEELKKDCYSPDSFKTNFLDSRKRIM